MNVPVSVKVSDNIGWVTINNPPVNATSQAVRAGLMEAVSRVKGCNLAVLCCTGKTFVAGGDMSEFDAPPVEPHLPDVVNAIEQSDVPFVALMQGNVLGGGLELAMACAFRIAHPGTRFGLPEVNVGLIPGAGGTQRAPRLLGWDMAIDMACLGKMKTANELVVVGAVDLITDHLQGAVSTLQGPRPTPVSRRNIPTMTDTHRDALHSKVTKAAKGRQAPLHNLTALEWATEPFEKAQRRERALHLELRGSAESVALRHVFFSERKATRPAALKHIEARPVTRVAIVGGGLMGAGIAAACLNRNLTVSITERDEASVKAAQDNVAQLMQGALKRGKINQSALDQRMAQFRAGADYALCADADLAIEAVFEDLDAKRAVFKALEGVVRDDALLATNTSYLNPDDIFSDISGQNRCLGLHFFSPAHIMKLVEVVQASSSSDTTLATGFSFASALRKTPVLSGICDGFIGNRILAAYRRAAEYLLADGALPQEVDAAMTKFGMAMGPFAAQDMSGLQIALAFRRRQDAHRAPIERYVTISDQLCALDRLGKRTNAGWYDYSTGKPEADDAVSALIEQYSKDHGITRHSFSTGDIQTQLLAAMANEGARIVEEGIAQNNATVDVVKTSGYGFPRHRGGPMHWADVVGRDVVMAALDTLDAASPGSWPRATRYIDTPTQRKISK
ncbi:3-hydroxyacyl-CoA dehydrogenase NAD-binding domain-containing protein [Tateyamaria sp.]|uniref:3-hydroxyacyl-CoA dehydrogenase NAD-binding domain-containing protein n=1 Tax=Tateyamaria sp. TaxID=1929288 RepID=UPI00329E9446